MADDDHLNGCMIALMPTADDAARLAVPGGEAAADLHLTLFFLGDDAADWDEDQRADLLYCLKLCLGMCDLEPVEANIFGVAHWNGGGKKPSWVWNVGESMDDDSFGMDLTLESAHHMVCAALEDMHRQPELPEQHCPWVPHVCAEYSDNLTLVRTLEERLGPITFDRIRVSFGSEDHDFPLNQPEEPGETEQAPGVPDYAALLADGALHRKATTLEQQSGIDFADMDRRWKSGVEGAMGSLASITYAWRYDLREQVVQAMRNDDPDALNNLTLPTDKAESVLYDAMREMAQKSGEAMQREAEKQGIKVPAWSIDDDPALTADVRGPKLLRSVASITSNLLSSNLIQAAKRRAMSLMPSRRSPESVGDTLSRDLSSLSDRPVRDAVANAMTAAQNWGRMAVLSRIPEPAMYMAVEALDKNTCKACSAIDGTEFSSLGAVQAAYPLGGYANCAGGGRCRGTFIAVWGNETASANRSISEIMPHRTGEPEVPVGDHVHFEGDVHSFAWDGSSSRFTDAQYQRAAAACDPGDGTVKERCFLLHHDPGGALNRDGLATAAGRSNQASSHTPEAVARAKAHLRSHYRQIGQPAPDNLAATAEEREQFGVEEGYEMTTFARGEPNPGTKKDKRLKENKYAAEDCPPGQMMDEATGKCVPMKPGMSVEETVHVGSRGVVFEYDEVQGPDPADIGGENTAPWRGPLTVEGIETGDGREFDTDSLTWADMPLPLRWNKEDSHGGDPHTVAVNVGRIDKIWREDSGLIMGEGLLDLSDDDGKKVHAKIEGKFLRGVSVDVDSVKGADMELIWPDQPDGEGDNPDPFAQMFAEPEKVVFHKGRIRAATLVDIPAFAEAYIALLNEEGAVVAGGEPIGALRAAQAPRHRSFAVDIPVRPPVEWFRNPDLSVPTGITVTADGRVYGHAALWGTCHIGQAGVCVTPPREDDHPYFMTGNVWTEDEASVSVGQITVGTNHAPLSYNHRAASDHYDNTGAAVADVSVGNDAHGIWVAGAIRPGASADRIHELRAAGQVSGDWRRIGGALRLVGLLAVNVPGFPVPKLKTYLAEGQQFALVASGIPQLTDTMSEDELDQWAFRRVLNTLSRRVNTKE